MITDVEEEEMSPAWFSPIGGSQQSPPRAHRRGPLALRSFRHLTFARPEAFAQ